MPTVLLDIHDDGVALVTLNRPDSLNAMGEDLLPRLADVLAACEADTMVRCVALTGAGRAFCAGGDVKGMASRNADAGSAARPTIDAGVQALYELQTGITARLHTMPKPTVALINGHAVGAGFSLAQACDLRIASDRAKFGTAFRNVGLSGDFGGSYFLPRLVGPGRARELYFSAEILDAEHARTLGIVNAVVPHDALLSEGLAICAELAQGPTAAFGRMKRNLNLGETGTLADVLRQEAVHMTFSRFDDDHREAARAFVEKRQPRFTGH